MIIPCPQCTTRFNLPDSLLGGKPKKVHCSKCGHTWMAKPGDGVPAHKPGAKPSAKPAEKKPLKKKIKKVAPAAPEPVHAPEPQERFPGMGGDYATSHHAPEDEPDHGSPAFGDDAWMNASSHSVDFGAFDGADKRGKGGMASKIQNLGRWLGFAAGIAGVVVFVLSQRTQIVELWPAAARLYEVLGMPVEAPGAGLQFQNVKSEQRLDNGATVLVLEGQIANVSAVERTVPAVVATSLGPDHKPVKSWHVVVTQTHLEPGAIATFRSQERDPGTVADIAITFVAE